MRIISWNVNGLRAAVKKHGFHDSFSKLGADVFCIQETKAQDDQVGEALKEIDNYALYANSAERKGYAGTAILAKDKPQQTSVDIGVAKHDQEGRVVRIEYDEFNLVNVYVPNSGSGLKRLDYRAEWDKAFKKYLAKLQKQKPLIVTGDFNVAHQAIDLARPKQNYNKTSGYTQVEIDGFSDLLSIGLVDIFRKLNPEKVAYTFWSQRGNARANNVGWRLDYFLISESLQDKVQSVEIHDRVGGSDHCPVSLEID